jgi:hypothetical protein
MPTACMNRYAAGKSPLCVFAYNVQPADRSLPVGWWICDLRLDFDELPSSLSLSLRRAQSSRVEDSRVANCNLRVECLGQISDLRLLGFGL